MTSFQLAATKLSDTGHGEDACRYFEWFKETIKGFPDICYYGRILRAAATDRPAEHRHFVRLPDSPVPTALCFGGALTPKA
jgi:hypothetical protein